MGKTPFSTIPFTNMISKNQAKLIRSLEMKKHRLAEKLFVAEGPKLVDELLRAYPCHYLAATPEWWEQQKKQTQIEKTVKTDVISPEELHRISLQKHPQQVLALFRLPMQDNPTELLSIPQRELCLALDDVQDPGNLGTIVRLADWFGIRHIFCSPGTADVYAPKAVQATMGSLARVQLHYGSLQELIKQQSLPTQAPTPVYGTFLDGTPLHQVALENHGILLMGNEGKGISPELAEMVSRRIYIPTYPAIRQEGERPESLNVAIATAILCAEFRRRVS